MSFAGLISGQHGQLSHDINYVFSFALGTTGTTNIHQKASEYMQTISWVICLFSSPLVSDQFWYREFLIDILGSAI